jgi:mono/diheme cytochrome c family protein
MYITRRRRFFAGSLATLMAILLITVGACATTTKTITAIVTVPVTLPITIPVTTVTIIPPTTLPPTVTGTLLNGQDIFLYAVDASGVYVSAQGFAMMTRLFGCADCHGIQGHGGTVYMMMAQYDVPNITWPELTGSSYIPPYTADTVKRAITQGQDQLGKSLDPFMPRWSMSSQDLNDVVSYLQSLK